MNSPKENISYHVMCYRWLGDVLPYELYNYKQSLYNYIELVDKLSSWLGD
jgi:hypothetical protein